MVNGLSSTVDYAYDDANRLANVNGVNYTWDNNGNLLNDGVNSYTYNTVNQLTAMNGAWGTSSYTYNGLGDRLQQVVNGNTTTFAMDLNTSLTQALSDGTNTYIYGIDRIAQSTGTGTEYFLPDALGSVRQIVDANAHVTYTRAYDPYGVVTQASGTSQTAYGYTNEYADSYIKFIYLRSRWYDPASGRFTARDSWQGDYNRPISLNRWNYVDGNPINYTDPTGFIKQNEAGDADAIVEKLKVYHVFVSVDWGTGDYWNTITSSVCNWRDGLWTLGELKALKRGTIDLANAMGGLNKFIFNIGGVTVLKAATVDPGAAAASALHRIKVNSRLDDELNSWSAVHELAHVWDINSGNRFSAALAEITGSFTDPYHKPIKCDIDPNNPRRLKRFRGCNDAGYYYGGTPPAGAGVDFNILEDFAESVATYVYPDKAQQKLKDLKFKGDPNYDFLYYDDYRKQPRWTYIYALMHSAADIQTALNH